MGQNARAIEIGAQYGRRLRLELLERRDLLTVIRLVDWNVLNGPNPANPTTMKPATDPDFMAVLQAIGNESVQGNVKRIDILALQETDPAGPGNDSIGRTVTIMNGLYPLASYASVVSTVDGGGDSTGFVYDTTTVTLENSLELSASLTHHIMRGKFRPAETTGDSDFYVYSVHLKSGATQDDEDSRTDEAAILRADADSLGEGAQVLFVGDFNMHGTSEGAYTTIVSAGAAQLQDVAGGELGEWFDNPAFITLHSHDTGHSVNGKMNDRFDIQFASGEFFNGVGLEYVPDSFHIFGNNGTHPLDGKITDGHGASPEILGNLVNASDHLPAVADYQLINSTPNVRITETGGNTKVIEGGYDDVYSVVLDTVPSANVIVTVTPDAQVDVGGNPSKVLTFTPANALTPQFVVVHAVDNGTSDPTGSHTGVITHSSASADAGYNALAINSVNVKIIDNETPAIVINEFDSDTPTTPSNDALEFVELYDGGVGNVSLVGKTLVFFNGSTNNAYQAISLTGSTNANGFYFIGDTGVAGVDQTFPASPASFLQNGPDAIALYSGSFSVGAAVTATNLLDAVVYDNGTAIATTLRDTLTPGQNIVNENANSHGDTESGSRSPDGGIPRETTTYVAQAPTPKAPNKPRVGSTLIAQSGSGLNVTEGGATDSYQFALLTVPTDTVTVTIDPDDETALNGMGRGVAIMLVFTPADALIPKTINVAAFDDAVVEGNHSSEITTTASSSDPAYNGLSIPKVVASIVDNDAPVPTNIVITELMYNPASPEGGPVGEWIEIYNAGTAPVDLSGWLIDDEDGTNWSAIPNGITPNSPNGTTLNSNQLAVIYDATFTDPATFQSRWSMPSSALPIGVSWGSLSNSPNADPLNPPLSEVIKLLDNHGIQKDVVNYDDVSPWPMGANGPSIYLKGWSLDNNSGANWAISSAGTANAVSPSALPFSTSDIGSPGRLPLPGDYSGNGVVDAADYTVRRDTFGSTTSLLADASGSTPGVPDSVVNQNDHTFWKNSFGLALGSGGESPAGGGGSTFEVVTAAAPVLSPAPPNNLAIDAAVADFAPAPVLQSSASAAKPRPHQHARFDIPASDLRSLATRHSADTREMADAPRMHSSSADDSQAVDEFCMSLGQRERAGRGLLLTL